MYYSLFSNKNGTDIIKSVTMSGSWSMLMAFFIYFYPTYMHISPERNKLTYCSFWQDRITLGKMDQNGNGTLTIENSTIKTLAQYNAAIDKGRRNAGNSLQQVAQAPEDHEPIVTTVERDPEYPGDWKRYLETNLRTDVAIDSGAAAGSYQAIVQFVVDVQGMVSELKVLKDPGFGMGAEAMRVIKKSGKWKPAIQDGRQVKAYRKQPITFTIQKDAP
ncbi:MAG: energy transducer TonB [Flavisolibacter sp.]|nr:energy transducer TonB [Flavisolibacter sp.]